MEKLLNSLLIACILIIGSLAVELAEYRKKLGVTEFMYNRSKATVAYKSVESELYQQQLDSLNRRLGVLEIKLQTIGSHLPITTSYYITGRYGDERDSHIHQGLDIAVPNGTPIYSPIAGRCFPSWDVNGGWIATVYNGKVMHKFMHCRYPPISGEVSPGSIVAFSGNTGRSSGPHLHWEVYIGEARIDPEDYLKTLK